MEKDGIDYLEKHENALKKTVQKIFSKELQSQDLSEKLPLIKWTEPTRVPSAFYLYLLCHTAKRKTVLFFEEMISNWLTPGEELKILSSKNLNFKLFDSKRSFFFAEFLIHIPDEKCLEVLTKHIQGVTDEMKLGSISYDHGRRILEMKRLSLAGKTSFLYDTLVNLIRRYPKLFGHDIFRELQHFHLHCKEEFRQIRHVRHLCRILCSLYLFQKTLEQDMKTLPFQRHLYLKLMKTYLHYSFGLKKVLGLSLALNSLRDYECLEFRHIFKAIERIIPNVQAHKESFYSYRNEEKSLLTFYLEIEKLKGSEFTLDELKKLKKELPRELKNSIEYLSPALFIPHNEDELIRNIIQLSQEIRTIRDLPQALISFQEQRNELLKFNVVLLRVLSKKEPSLQTLSRLNFSNVHFIPERVANVGLLRKKYVKEANVFSLEVENKPFLRKNHSVDLIKARQYVVKSLEKMIGNFRDFNEATSINENAVPPATKSEKRQNSQVLHLHLPRAAQSLDPRLGADRTSGIVIKMLFEGLFRTSVSGEIENAIAKEVILSQDGLKYTFKLRKSFWSNGSPLTAYDFEYAWKKILEPDFRFPYSFLFFPIKNAEAAKRGEKSIQQVGVRALDPETLLIELEYKASYFLGLTTSWVFSPLCQEIDQKHPGWAYHSGETYVCNGPFKLDIWKRNDDLQVIKNPNYWDAQSVKLDQIKITIIEDEKVALSKFFKQEVDWIGDPLNKLSPIHIPKLSQKGLVHSAPSQYGLFWIQLNIHRFPLKNAKIRKALALAINRELLIKKVLYSEDIPAFGFAHKPENVNSQLFKEGDLKTALQLFEEGLIELRIKREEFPPLIFTHSEIEEQEATSREIGRQWQEAFGINVKYERLLWNHYFETLSRGDMMVGAIVWYPRFEDAIYYHNLFIFREHSLHITNWKNSAFNEYVEKAKRTADPKKRLVLLTKAEKILIEEMPVIPLIYQKFRYVKNPRLKDYILSNINQIDFRKAYLETQVRNKI